MGRRGIAIVAAAVAAIALSLAAAAPAGASQLVEFETGAALAFNGSVPAVPAKPLEEVKESCGSETTTWGSELLTTSPSEIKVKNEWGDIVPGKEVMVSGTIHNVVSPGDADIPIDHPFSADTTFDVALDEPYWNLARELTAESEGHPSKHELHMELETGAFPHVLPQLMGPAVNQPWDLLPSEVQEREEKGESTQTLIDDASLGLVSGYIPQEGDRVAMRGRWIIDCGHNDFHGELHPITFMAFGHAEGSKTVVHVVSNGYRVTQLYGPGTAGVNNPPKGKPFPEGFEQAASNLVASSFVSPLPSPLELLGGLERTVPNTVPVKICPPEGGSGNLSAAYSFVRRAGVNVAFVHPKKARCAVLKATLNLEKYKAQQPRARTCGMPWPWLSDRIAQSLGIEGVRASEVESIKVNATGGTFTISYGANTTAPIPYNATASQVQEALETLPGIAPGDITVVGGPGGENPYTLLFGGALAEQPITPVRTDRSGLTGGASLASVVVLRPGGELDLRRFVLSLIERKAKVGLEEKGAFEAIQRIESNMQLTPQASCVDQNAGPAANFEKHIILANKQAIPYYGEVQVQFGP